MKKEISFKWVWPWYRANSTFIFTTLNIIEGFHSEDNPNFFKYTGRKEEAPFLVFD